MLTFKLNNEPTNIQLKFVLAEKSSIFKPHKSYKITLAVIIKRRHRSADTQENTKMD